MATAADKPLNIVVVGRPNSGKTSLVAALTLSLSPSAAATLPRPPPLPTHPFTQPPLALRRLTRLLGRLAQVLRPRDTGHVGHVVPAPAASHAARWAVYDVASAGIVGVARKVFPDIVIVTTPLDESRCEREDGVLFDLLGRYFGRRVWKRLLVVCTRGCALPPPGIGYKAFLRGRRDQLWREYMYVVPPVLEDGDDGFAALTVIKEREVEMKRREIDASRRPAGARWVTPVLEEGGSVLGRGRSGEGAGPEEGEGGHVEEREREALPKFRDPAPPDFAVVELAQSCPRNERGQRILPNGLPWMDELLLSIERVVLRAVQTEGPVQMSMLTTGLYIDRSAEKKFSEHLSHLAHRGIFVATVQFLLVTYLVPLLARTIEKRDAKERSERSDVVLELSDKEYEALTRKDFPMQTSKVLEGLDDADNYFFGPNSSLEGASGGDGDQKSTDATTQQTMSR